MVNPPIDRKRYEGVKPVSASPPALLLMKIPWFLFLLVLMPIHRAPAAGNDRFIQDRFAIGFWSDPPADKDMEARYSEIAQANFTFVIGVFGATSPPDIDRELAYCEKYGLKAIVSMAGRSPDQLPTNSACWGYFLADEPSPDSFPGLKNLVDAIHKSRPGKLAYINLYPNYVVASAIGNKSYAEHVAQFLSEVHPDLLSMDHYPHFLPRADGRAAYCENLDVLRKQSLAAEIPFWNFFNSMPYGDHSDPTEAQLRWQIFTSLAYGAKGVMYFCYWTPAGAEFPKGGAILSRSGVRSRHYEEARRINATLKNLGPTLMQMTNIGVVRIKPQEDATSLLKGTALRSLSESSSALLAGFFKHPDGRRGVMLNNYEFAYSAWPTVAFDADSSKVVEVDCKTGKEVPLRDESPDMPGIQISLDAGAGRLFLVPAQSGG